MLNLYKLEILIIYQAKHVQSKTRNYNPVTAYLKISIFDEFLIKFAKIFKKKINSLKIL